MVQMIDEFFARQVKIFEQGIPRTVTNFEAIILQLWTKAMAGNKRLQEKWRYQSDKNSDRPDNCSRRI